ncbi:MAG: M28 family peptidase [Chthoniobacterales bacterium]
MKSLLHHSTTPLLLFLLFGCHRAEKSPATGATIWAEFSGESAFAHVQQLVDLGPRPPQSDALEKTRVYIDHQLRLAGWTVERQEFADETPRGLVRFANLIARFHAPGKTPMSFLLCSHYDTKIFDTFRFVGANDAGSSTGLLLEMARVLSRYPDLAAKVELVFFDGEESFETFSDIDGLYGSRHFAKQLGSEGAKQFRGGLLFDMVGDRDLTITLPPDSPAQIARDIFASADALKVRNHFTYFNSGVTDDHTPLNQIGIPVIDLIDFDYPPWHTSEDTLDKISPESLRIVGSVALYYLANYVWK